MFTSEEAGQLAHLWQRLSVGLPPRLQLPHSSRCRRWPPLIWKMLTCITKQTECRNKTEKNGYLCRLPDRIWVLEPHPATLKWILKCFESNNRHTSYTFARFKDGSQDYQHFDIWMMGWWTGAPLPAGSDQSQERNASSPPRKTQARVMFLSHSWTSASIFFYGLFYHLKWLKTTSTDH